MGLWSFRFLLCWKERITAALCWPVDRDSRSHPEGGVPFAFLWDSSFESSGKLIFSLFLERKFVLDLGPWPLLQPLLRMFFVEFRWQPLSHSLAFESMSPPQGSLHGLLCLKQHPTPPPVPLYPITVFHFVQALTCYLKIPVYILCLLPLSLARMSDPGEQGWLHLSLDLNASYIVDTQKYLLKE